MKSQIERLDSLQHCHHMAKKKEVITTERKMRQTSEGAHFHTIQNMAITQSYIYTFLNNTF